LPVKHGIKIDDTENIGERHAQGAAHFCDNRLRQPAIEILGSVQGWQECRAALRRQVGKNRTQGLEFAISHLAFPASVVSLLALPAFIKARERV
jgi:hypothetical protein